jgi:hypothetical protein
MRMQTPGKEAATNDPDCPTQYDRSLQLVSILFFHYSIMNLLAGQEQLLASGSWADTESRTQFQAVSQTVPRSQRHCLQALADRALNLQQEAMLAWLLPSISTP